MSPELDITACGSRHARGHLSGALVESLGFVSASVLDFSTSLESVCSGGEGTCAGDLHRQRCLGRRVRVAPRAALRLWHSTLSGEALSRDEGFGFRGLGFLLRYFSHYDPIGRRRLVSTGLIVTRSVSGGVWCELSSVRLNSWEERKVIN